MQFSTQTAPPSATQTQAAGITPLDQDPAEIRAFVEAPTNAQALFAFLGCLKRLDPAKPRSADLDLALIAALSSPSGDVKQAQIFAQTTLFYEFSSAQPAASDRVALSPSTLSLLTALLYHRCNDSLLLEPVLIELRNTLLTLAETGEKQGQDLIDLAEAMARHSFTNEYIWDVTQAEQASVDRLCDRVTQAIETGGVVQAFDLFLVGAFQPLDRIPAIQTWVRQITQQAPSELNPTLQLLVLNRLIENDLPIDTLTPMGSDISADVRAQYEENPYPRWRHLPGATACDGIETYVETCLSRSKVSSRCTSLRPKVLIAGAGTGQHPIFVAQNLPTAAVLAIDLSRASLAYGIREAAMRGVNNIAFGQGDILKLTGVEAEFDLIESVGVLHHMEDPERGLQALIKALKPGGFLKLGLYSKTARQAVIAARAQFQNGDYPPGLAGIRAFRKDLIKNREEHPFPLWAFHDFYKASEFRDLCMHVQEHQFSLPEIKSLLKRNGLSFLGFTTPDATRALSQMPSKLAKRRMRDFQAWERYEKRNPGIFANMYQFFCVKA